MTRSAVAGRECGDDARRGGRRGGEASARSRREKETRPPRTRRRGLRRSEKSAPMAATSRKARVEGAPATAAVTPVLAAGGGPSHGGQRPPRGTARSWQRQGGHGRDQRTRRGRRREGSRAVAAGRPSDRCPGWGGPRHTRQRPQRACGRGSWRERLAQRRAGRLQLWPQRVRPSQGRPQGTRRRQVENPDRGRSGGPGGVRHIRSGETRLRSVSQRGLRSRFGAAQR